MKYKFGAPSPFKHQIQTFKDLVQHKAWGVFSEPGTGKTRSLVCAAEALAQNGKSKRALYVCPDAIRETIGREIAKWTQLSCTVLSGSSRDRAKQLASTDTYFYVVNYDSCPLITKELSDKKFDLVICDESTRVRNISAQRYKALKQISRDTEVRWIATGTPMPRDPLDLHGQFSLINPGLFGSSNVFKSEYIRYAMVNGCIPVIVGYKNQEKLQQIIAANSTRFLKSECLDLPEKIHVNCEVPMSPAQQKIYDQFYEELMAELPSGTIMPIRSVMAKLMRFQQVTTGFVGSNDTYLEWFGNSKADFLMDLLETIDLDQHKVIIWCSYTPSIDKLRELLKDRNPALFYGEVANKDPEIQKFNEDPTCRVMIGNSKVGIGCTLNVAKYVVYFELPYFDTEALTQSQDRNHRIGQTEKVTYYYLLAPGTVDETILKNLEGKFKLAGYLTGDDAKMMLKGGGCG